jgi:hypothetical protein
MALQRDCGGAGVSFPAAIEDKATRRRRLKGVVLGAMADIPWRFVNNYVLQ